MALEEVIADLKVRGLETWNSTIGRARSSLTGISRDAKETQKGTTGAAQGLLKAAGGAVATYKAYQGLKSSVNTTLDLAKSTAGFSRASGLSTKESQAWVTVAKSRGIQTQQLQMGMAAFGRQLGTTGKEGAGTSKALAQLGVDQAALARMPMAERMSHIANAFKQMPDGVDKAATAQRLFGRAGQTLLPLLNSGAEGLQKQLDTANRLVPPLGKAGASALEMAKKQREMKMALTGVQTTIGTALIPILSSLLAVFAPVLGAFTTALTKVPGLSHALVILGTALGVLMVLNKVNGLLRAFNITLLSNPIMLVVAGVAALVLGLVLAYQKVGWFRNAVNAAFGAVQTAISAVFNWVKANWPLLLMILTGPIGAAVILIIQNWTAIKNATVAAFNAVKGAVSSAANVVGQQIGRMVSFVTGLPGKIASVAKGAFNGLIDGAKSAAAGAWRQFTWLVDQIRKLPGTISRFIGSLGSSVGDALKNSVKSVLPGPLADLLATGGVIAAQTGTALGGGGRNVLVGERGPEMLSLPSGSRVTPLPPPTLAASQLGAGGERPIVTQVFLDRRQIASAFASYAAEQQAAR